MAVSGQMDTGRNVLQWVAGQLPEAVAEQGVQRRLGIRQWRVGELAGHFVPEVRVSAQAPLGGPGLEDRREGGGIQRGLLAQESFGVQIFSVTRQSSNLGASRLPKSVLD